MNDAYDLLVLGSGAAGLSVVLRALALNPALKIAVIAKNAAASGSTAQAQGGIAAVLDATDTIESHVATLWMPGRACAIRSRCALSPSARGKRSTGWLPRA